MLCGHEGDVYFLNELMSVYRTNLPESWTKRLKYNSLNIANHCIKSTKSLDEFNLYTDKEYSKEIQVIQKRISKNVLSNYNYRRHLNKEDLSLMTRDLNIQDKIIVFIMTILKSIKTFFKKGLML